MVWVGNEAGRDLRSRWLLPTQEPPGVACPACSPSPLPCCLHPSSSAAPLGSFLPKSLAGIFLFFPFPPDLFLLVRFPWPWGAGYLLPLRSSSLAGGGGCVSPPVPVPHPRASHVSHTRPPRGSCHPSALFPLVLGSLRPLWAAALPPSPPVCPQHCPLGSWGSWLPPSLHLAVE